MPENIIIQPNKPLFVRLVDPMNTDNFDFQTNEAKFETSTGQTLKLPRPAVVRLYVLEPGPGEELEILKKWSGKKGDPVIWSVRRAQEPASEGQRAPAPIPFPRPVERPQEPETPSKPTRKKAAQAQPGLFDGRHQPTCNAVLLPGELDCNCISGPPERGTGTYGPMPAGVAYAAPKLEIARKAPSQVIPWNVAFREVSAWVAEELRANHLQWSDTAQQAAVCTVLINEHKAGRVGPWERGK